MCAFYEYASVPDLHLEPLAKESCFLTVFFFLHLIRISTYFYSEQIIIKGWSAEVERAPLLLFSSSPKWLLYNYISVCIDAAQWLADKAHNCLSVCIWADRLMGNIRSVRTHYTRRCLDINWWPCDSEDKQHNVTSDKDVSPRDFSTV